MRTALLIFTLSLLCQTGIKAQDSISNPAKKPWLLSWQFDMNLKKLSGKYDYNYQGEYFLQGQNHWIYTEKKEKYDKLFDNASFTSLQMAVLLGRRRDLHFGLSYTFGIVQKIVSIDSSQKQVGYFDNTRVFSYLAICGIAEYDYFFHKNKADGPFLLAILTPGFYRANDELEGVGGKYFLQGRIGAGYQYKNWQFRTGLSNDYLWYRERSESQVFNRPEKVDIFLNTHYLFLGIAHTFSLIPD